MNSGELPEVNEAMRQISLDEEPFGADKATARPIFLRANRRILREQNANETIHVEPVEVETFTDDLFLIKQINLVFASTRMNPPTPGHMRVLEELIMQGIQKETNEVYVVLSKKNDDEYNPMNCKDKIYYLNGFNENEQQNDENIGVCVPDSMVCALKRKMIETNPDIPQEKINNMKVILKCVDERHNGPFNKVIEIIQNKLSMIRTWEGQKLKVYLVVGDDRRGTLRSMENMIINKENANHISFEEIVIPREDIGDLKSMSPEDIHSIKISPNQMSGTLVRKLAIDAKEKTDKFLEIYSDYISDDKKRSLLGNINEGLSRIKQSREIIKQNRKQSPDITNKKKNQKIPEQPASQPASQPVSDPAPGNIGGSKKIRRLKTVKNKRKFRKKNNKTKNNKMKNNKTKKNKTKNNKMKNRRRTRKHK